MAEATQAPDTYAEEHLLQYTGNNLLALQDMREDEQHLHYLRTGQTITEQLSTMHACLANGNTEQAQRILVGMYRLYPQAMQEVADVSVHNEIICGLLAAKPQPLTTQALQWYDLMDNQYSIKPNANTFAILISGFVNNGLSNVALVLMQEMLRNGHTIHSMLLSPYVSDADIQQIKAMAQGIVGDGTENTQVASMLLDEMAKAEANLKNIAPGQNVGDGGAADAQLVSLDGINTAARARRREREMLDSANVAGITQLKKTLESLYEGELEGYNLQMRLERDTYDAALARYREINAQRNDPLLSSDVGQLKRLSATWLPRLEALIEEEQQRCRKALGESGNDRTRSHYADFFVQLDAAKMATITILEALRLHMVPLSQPTKDGEPTTTMPGIKTVQMVTVVSKAIHDEIRFEQMKKRTNRHVFGYNLSLARLATSGKLFNMAIRRAKARELREQKDRLFLDAWSVTTKTRIGSLLVSMLLEAARIHEGTCLQSALYGKPGTDPTVPVFTHGYAMLKGKRYGIIKLHHLLRELFKDEPVVGVVNARHLPMLVPPRPWMTYTSGGYLTQDEPCMRMKESAEQLQYLKRASNEDRLGTLLAGLDALGMTKWAINRPIFHAVSKVWNSGRALAEVPARSYDAPEPVRPDDYATDNASKYKYLAELREWKNNRANQHSQRCDCNYKIEIAQAFLDHPMYFPHNMDFRGRAYPIPPHFNHLGNDLCRGLLVFHEGRPLTERGIYWLKIHLANLFGKDKLSHAERIRFVNDNFGSIAACADDPVPDAFLAGEPGAARPWWLDAESPWQALAACAEYTAAMRSPDPSAFVSHLHIHQDGTCNGLQHYAAMGRDRTGAQEVNLAPSECPQDVYAGILRVVERLVDEDAKAGVAAAAALRNRLTRKIVKQTVMTNVYGVTLIGAKEQIAARLREVKDESGQHLFDIMAVPSLALYLARKIFASLGEMFTQAQEIQNWLNESAQRVAKSMPVSALATWKTMVLESKQSKEKLRAAIRDSQSTGSILDSDTVLGLRPDLGPGSTRRKRLDALATKPMSTVVWTTPLGLTVVQPYRKSTTRTVSTSLQHLQISDANMPSPVNSQKQKTAFPPNFVHSLDASHMVLSAIECRVAGLVFASVHDSYWTHACDVDQMNDILRDQFVKLHEMPIMHNLKAEFEQRYGNHKMPTVFWEYVVRFGLNAGGVVQAKPRTRSKKVTREEEERLVEAELARHHLEACTSSVEDGTSAETESSVGDEIGTDEIGANTSGNAAARAGPMVVLDLNTVKLINPSTDLVGAMRQADHIAYTVRVNRQRLVDETKALRKDYRARIREMKLAAAKATRAKAKSDKQKKKAESAAAKGDKKKAESAVTKVKEEVEVPIEDPESEAVPESLSDRVWVLEEEMSSAINALSAKYPVEFEVPKIMVAPLEMPEQFEHASGLIREGKLAGRLTKRIEWGDIKFSDLPEQGDFDIAEVRKSQYFFS
ncbi:DNA-directed RNA polymerase [Coemansia biformis]|uniref:DNA-directed RNA polymerase n=1 Tax=Coemansia biformis TaxID=1286918 RepID=A0A9W7YII7_9FUNG|nr:DNA-directed RNA polymerase [Coemansia biformis]